MNDYQHYRAGDFMTDPDFIRWVFEKNAEDDFFWQQWLIKNPQKQPAVEEAITVLHTLNIKERQLDEEVMRGNISTIINKAIEKPHTRLFTFYSLWKYAAILIIIIGAGFLVTYLTRSPVPKQSDTNLSDTYMPQKTSAMLEEMNNEKKEKIIHLQDGSTVSLSPGTMIRYSNTLSSNVTRDIYLSGEAFFEVTKNPQKPFRVFSHELVTKVLGTSFFIKANAKDENISVIVKTGKVSVYNNNNNDSTDINSNQLTGVVLTPNQQLLYSRNELKFQKTLIERPMLLHPSEIKNDFQYEEVPVADVLEQLKKAFGIDIIYDKEAIKNCKITADLIDESIYKKLELICKAMDATYHVIDGQVTIDAKPCEPAKP